MSCENYTSINKQSENYDVQLAIMQETALENFF